MNLANKITLVRILTIPLIVIAMLQHHNLTVYLLLGFSMITDFLDGLVARRRGERTKLGAFLDPMADKLLLSSVYLTLTYLGVLNTWVFVLIFSRDLLIVLGWLMILILTGSTDIQPRRLGKVTTAAQMTCALLYMITPVPGILKMTFLWVAVALTVASTIDYVFVGNKRLVNYN